MKLRILFATAAIAALSVPASAETRALPNGAEASNGATST